MVLQKYKINDIESTIISYNSDNLYKSYKMLKDKY